MSNLMPLIAKNLLLGLALAAAPLLAEALAAIQAKAPGDGVRLLLYWPFDFGLAAFALTAFYCLNAYELRQRSGGFLVAAFAGLTATAIWFCATFLLVFQVHVWRGGQV